MGNLLIDSRESGGTLQEYDTTTCSHCNAIIIYKSIVRSGSVKKVRISISGTARYEEVGSGYFCHKCNGDICYWCGYRATRGTNRGPCKTMERAAYEMLSSR